MEIAEFVVKFGALVVAGFVRDVYIRKEDVFNDIDIVCELGRREDFLKYLKDGLNAQYDSTCIPESSNVPLCKRVDILHVGNIKLEVMYYTSLDDWKCRESTVDCTHSLFYFSSDGLGIQYLPDGYTREELLNLIYHKKFRHLDARLTTNERIMKNIKRSEKFERRGWKLVF